MSGGARVQVYRLGALALWATLLFFIDVVGSETLRLVLALSASVLAGALVGRWWSLLAPLGFVAFVLAFGAVADPSQNAVLGWWDWDDGELFLETGYFGLIATLAISAAVIAGAMVLGIGLRRLGRRLGHARRD